MFNLNSYSSNASIGDSGRIRVDRIIRGDRWVVGLV